MIKHTDDSQKTHHVRQNPVYDPQPAGIFQVKLQGQYLNEVAELIDCPETYPGLEFDAIKSGHGRGQR